MAPQFVVPPLRDRQRLVISPSAITDGGEYTNERGSNAAQRPWCRYCYPEDLDLPAAPLRGIAGTSARQRGDERIKGRRWAGGSAANHELFGVRWPDRPDPGWPAAPVTTTGNRLRKTPTSNAWPRRAPPCGIVTRGRERDERIARPIGPCYLALAGQLLQANRFLLRHRNTESPHRSGTVRRRCHANTSTALTSPPRCSPLGVARWVHWRENT